MNIDLEDILLNSHAIKNVWPDQCDYSAELECECGWKGPPRDFGHHILVALGMHDVVLRNWTYAPYIYDAVNQLKEKGISAPSEGQPELQEYLNIYRSPKEQYHSGYPPKVWNTFTKEERKEKKKAFTQWINKLRDI